MRLHISVGKNDINGYVNVDLSKHQIDFDNMDVICEPSECTEIFLDEVLSYITLQQIPAFLQRFISRLRINGKIIIDGFNLNSAAKEFVNGTISLADINYIFFGVNPAIRKCSCLSHVDVQNILSEHKLKIQSVEINQMMYTITAEREK